MTRPIIFPAEIKAALEAGAFLSLSVSGGKDSQAMIAGVMAAQRENHWPGQVIALHMDLGKAEWPQSLGMCERLAAAQGLPLVVRRREKGDLVDRMEERLVSQAGTGKPFWPSSAARYCTAELKRNVADKEFRALTPDGGLIISAEGLRAQESPRRAKHQPVEVRKQITAERLADMTPAEALAARKPGERLALNWYPILDWTLDEDVWPACGTSTEEVDRRRALYKAGRHAEALEGATVHVAYIFGNTRLSCVFCVLASVNDLTVGARHHPELFAHYLDMEVRGKATFKNGWSLAEIAAEAGNAPVAVDNWPLALVGQPAQETFELFECGLS